MMNDLDVMGDVNLWKYVDDSTLSEVIDKHSRSAMQDYVNEFALKFTANGTQLKESKCKELRIGFSTIRRLISTPLLSMTEKSRLFPKQNYWALPSLMILNEILMSRIYVRRPQPVYTS